MSDHTDAAAEQPMEEGQGDNTDARSFGSTSGSLFGQLGGSVLKGRPGIHQPMEETVYEGFEYRMDYPKRGQCIIFNNKTFDRKTGMNERSGTDVDAAQLYQRFKAMEFDVNLYHNKTCTEMLRIMSTAGSANHSDCDCFVACVLSHGDEGVIYGTDGIIKIDTLVAPMKNDKCKTLAGKPKIFIIQACRGSQLDHGVEVADSSDAEKQESVRIPSEADVLMAYSTVPGYFSWRNSTRGSWFAQAFVKVLEKYGEERDLVWMLHRVNYKVAYDFESNASREYMNRKKQIPCIMSMLTKDVYFRAKKT